MELRDACNFEDDSVYIMMAVARKKENEQLTSSGEVVFREIVENERNIQRKREKLHTLANGYTPEEGGDLNFRLYFTINARDTLSAYWMFQDRMNGWIQDMMRGDEAAQQKINRIDEEWKSILQKPANRHETRFIFDLDDCTYEEMESFYGDVSAFGAPLLTQETPNGYHIVTKPFNYNELDMSVDYELKTDGMLFIEMLTDGVK